MRQLYLEAWERLAMDRAACPEIEPECTPVLAFGQWQTAKIVTVGLNPSEDEFRDKQGRPLEEPKQRFLHWPADGELTPSRLELAFARAEGYFLLGNAYQQWFDRYDRFLEALGVSFKAGTACHTDLESPFASVVGISKCNKATRDRLGDYGPALWLQIVETMPKVQLVLGHGRNWRNVRSMLGISTWQGLKTPFDAKGGKTNVQRPFLLFAKGVLPKNRREVGVYWWQPNPDGSPLAWLDAQERFALGEFVREHARSHNILPELAAQ